MTPRHLLILATLTIPTLLVGQLKPVYFSKDNDKEADCNYFAKINEPRTDLQKQRLFIHCLVHGRGELSRALFMLDSLNKLYNSDDLINDKARYLALFRPCDTTYLSIQRQLIEKGYLIFFSYTQLGIYYMNYVAVGGTDTSSVKMNREKKIELLELSKSYLNKGLNDPNTEKGYTFIYLPQVEKELCALKGLKIQELSTSTKFDSLIIIADIPDCGEFGGHFEYIKVYREPSTFVAKFTSDSTKCQDGFKRDEPIHTPTRTHVSLTSNVLSHNFFRSIETGSHGDEHFFVYVYVNDILREYSAWENKGTNRIEYEKFKQDIFK